MVASVSYCLYLDKYSLSILTCFGFDTSYPSSQELCVNLKVGTKRCGTLSGLKTLHRYIFTRKLEMTEIKRKQCRIRRKIEFATLYNLVCKGNFISFRADKFTVVLLSIISFLQKFIMKTLQYIPLSSIFSKLIERFHSNEWCSNKKVLEVADSRLTLSPVRSVYRACVTHESHLSLFKRILGTSKDTSSPKLLHQSICSKTQNGPKSFALSGFLWSFFFI